MDSDEHIMDKHMGFNYLIQEGKEIFDSGDTSYLDIEIDPEEFKMLIFTSGTTSKSKGVMICNRNLAANINAVSAASTGYTDKSHNFFLCLSYLSHRTCPQWLYKPL